MSTRRRSRRCAPRLRRCVVRPIKAHKALSRRWRLRRPSAASHRSWSNCCGAGQAQGLGAVGGAVSPCEQGCGGGGARGEARPFELEEQRTLERKKARALAEAQQHELHTHTRAAADAAKEAAEPSGRSRATLTRGPRRRRRSSSCAGRRRRPRSSGRARKARATSSRPSGESTAGLRRDVAARDDQIEALRLEVARLQQALAAGLTPRPPCAPKAPTSGFGDFVAHPPPGDCRSAPAARREAAGRRDRRPRRAAPRARRRRLGMPGPRGGRPTRRREGGHPPRNRLAQAARTQGPALRREPPPPTPPPREYQVFAACTRSRPREEAKHGPRRDKRCRGTEMQVAVSSPRDEPARRARVQSFEQCAPTSYEGRIAFRQL